MNGIRSLVGVDGVTEILYNILDLMSFLKYGNDVCARSVKIRVGSVDSSVMKHFMHILYEGVCFWEVILVHRIKIQMPNFF